MAWSWSWSHTQEGIQNARNQMEAMDRETRNVIAAEWLAKIKSDNYGCSELDTRKYYRSLPRVQQWDDDKLNEFIWTKMEEYATCSNGGWEAYCCPFDCGCHTVPFDPVEGQEDYEGGE